MRYYKYRMDKNDYMFPVRVANTLSKLKIDSFEKLQEINYTDIMQVQGCGKKTCAYILNLRGGLVGNNTMEFPMLSIICPHCKKNIFSIRVKNSENIKK